MKGKFTPNGQETDFGSFTFDSNTGYTDCRISSRQLSLTVTGATNQDFKLGKVRANVKSRGKR